MTQFGDDYWNPEMVFIFGTIFIIRYNKEKQLEILWTLQKDRAYANIWTPPGGEWEMPRRTARKSLIQIADTGLREVKEEIGVEAKILGCGPFWECLVPKNYPRFTGVITTEVMFNKIRQTRDFYKQGAHSMLLFYLGKIIKGEPICAPQPKEKECEIVQLAWLTIPESFAAFENRQLKTYPALIAALKRLQWIMESRRKNPFIHAYPF